MLGITVAIKLISIFIGFFLVLKTYLLTITFFLKVQILKDLKLKHFILYNLFFYHDLANNQGPIVS